MSNDESPTTIPARREGTQAGLVELVTQMRRQGGGAGADGAQEPLASDGRIGSGFYDVLRSVKCNRDDSVAICVVTFPSTSHLKQVVDLATNPVASFTVRVVHVDAASTNNLLIGFLDHAAQEHCRYSLGSAGLPRSLGIAHTGAVVMGGQQLGTIGCRFVENDVVTLRFASGALEVQVNGEAVTLPESVLALRFCGKYRFGVSLTEERQAVKIGPNSLSSDDQAFLLRNCLDVRDPSKIRFVNNMQSIKVGPCGSVACCVRSIAATTYVPAQHFGTGESYSLTVRVLAVGRSKSVIIGIMDQDPAKHSTSSLGASDLRGSLGFSGDGMILMNGSPVWSIASFAVNDVVTIAVDGSGQPSLTLNGSVVALSDALRAIRYRGHFRFAVSLMEAGQAVKIGAEEATSDETAFLASHNIRIGCRLVQPAVVVDELVWLFELSRELVTIDYSMRLGRGGRGQVFRGIWDGAPVAVKELRWEDDPRQLRDIVVGRSLSHHNIANVHGWCRDGASLLIVMPLCEEGTLEQQLDGVEIPKPAEGGPLGWLRFFEVSVGVLRALRYMCSRTPPAIHRNLRPSNILMQGGKPRLTDFGLSNHTTTTRTHTGVLTYMAPEMLEGEPQTPAVDIWSFACVALEMLQSPHKPRDVGMSTLRLMREIVAGTPPDMSDIPQDLCFIEECFRRNPAERPSAEYLLNRMTAAAASRNLTV